MRPAHLIALLVLAPPAGNAQTSLWKDVPTTLNIPHTSPGNLPPHERAVIRGLFKTQPKAATTSSCSANRGLDEFQLLSFATIAQHGPSKIILAEDLSGTCTGGTSGTRDMWLVRLTPHGASFLAKPRPEFSGWISNTLPGANPLYPDIILGWHMSAAETDLTYLRFNGHRYRKISTATEINNGETATITPD